MKLKKGVLLILFVIIILLASFTLFMIYGLSSVSDGRSVEFVINSGDTKLDITSNLVEAGLIKSSLAANIYIYLTGNEALYAGTYQIESSYSTIDIIGLFQQKDNVGTDTIQITFLEGQRLTEYALVISENFNYTYDEVVAVMCDETFLLELIDKYEYLTTDILNEDLYYPLEGYLAGDTYEFYKDASIEAIVEKLVANRFTQLDSVLEDIDSSNYSFHDIITIASITELEANNYEDREDVAQVIYTRLELNMNLGMDVTTYYGSQVDLKEELYQSHLDDNNAYNTRVSTFYGLPVGPICNPSLESIVAALNPGLNDYIYFYADVTGDVSFFEYYDDFVVFKNNQ